MSDPLAKLKRVTEHLVSPELIVRLLDKLPDALVVVNRDRKIVLVNERAELLFGYHRSEMLGEGVEMLVPKVLEEAHVEHSNGYMQHPTTRPMGENLKLHAVKKSGREIPVKIMLAPLQTPDGLFVSAVIREKLEQ